MQRRVVVMALACAIAIPAEGLRHWASASPGPSRGNPSPGGRITSSNFLAHRGNRRRRSSLRRPAPGANSVVHDCNRHGMLLRHSCPRGGAVLHAHDASVPRLLLARGPSAVIRRVSQGVVLALDGQMVGVSVGHGPGMEGFELKPLGAHLNTLAAVHRMRLVSTPAQHVFPAVMQARSSLAVRGDASPPCAARARAPTGKTFPISEVCAAGDALFPAVAPARPQCAASYVVACLMEHRPKAER